MKQDIHDWKNEHLHNESWRIKGFLADVLTTSIKLTTGLTFHIHVYTKMNVPAAPTGKGLPGGTGMDASRFAFSTQFKCRCGHSLGHWEDIVNNDVNSLYPWQLGGYKKGDKVVISAGRGLGKSYFNKMYMGQWKQDE